jgi:hypothetical protein
MLSAVAIFWSTISATRSVRTEDSEISCMPTYIYLLNPYIHTCIHTYILIYLHTFIHTFIHYSYWSSISIFSNHYTGWSMPSYNCKICIGWLHILSCWCIVASLLSLCSSQYNNYNCYCTFILINIIRHLHHHYHHHHDHHPYIIAVIIIIAVIVSSS